ncbi:MAG: hypothetical protein ACRDWS_04855 [Acidimicrobiia bacterium]
MAAGDEVPKTPVAPKRPSLETGDRVLVCDVGGIATPDLATVEALAHLQVSVHDMGYSLHLRYATTRLQELLDLCGLSDALPVCEGSPRVDQGQREQREEPGGVEEEVEPGDPAP